MPSLTVLAGLKPKHFLCWPTMLTKIFNHLMTLSYKILATLLIIILFYTAIILWHELHCKYLQGYLKARDKLITKNKPCLFKYCLSLFLTDWVLIYLNLIYMPSTTFVFLISEKLNNFWKYLLNRKYFL